MTSYVHHVPGRLRMKSRYFHASNTLSRGLVKKLSALDGIRSVRLNSKSGSITVHYDTDELSPQRLSEKLHFLGTSSTRTVNSSGASEITSELPSMFRKILISTLMQKGINYSFTTLMSRFG